METRLEAIGVIVRELCTVDYDKTMLQAAFVTSEHPLNYDLEAILEGLSTAGFWAERAGDYRRRTKDSMEKLKWQAIEGVLERAAHTLDKGVMAKMHQNNMVERQYQQSGR